MGCSNQRDNGGQQVAPKTLGPAYSVIMTYPTDQYDIKISITKNTAAQNPDHDQFDIETLPVNRNPKQQSTNIVETADQDPHHNQLFDSATPDSSLQTQPELHQHTQQDAVARLEAEELARRATRSREQDDQPNEQAVRHCDHAKQDAQQPSHRNLPLEPRDDDRGDPAREKNNHHSISRGHCPSSTLYTMPLPTHWNKPSHNLIYRLPTLCAGSGPHTNKCKMPLPCGPAWTSSASRTNSST